MLCTETLSMKTTEIIVCESVFLWLAIKKLHIIALAGFDDGHKNANGRVQIAFNSFVRIMQRVFGASSFVEYITFR